MIRLLSITASMILFLTLSHLPASAEFDWDQKVWYGQGVFSIPLGHFSDAAGIGLGLGGGVSAPFTEAINGRAELELIYFTGKHDIQYLIFPFLALVEFHFNPDVPAYGLGGLGIAWRRASWDYSNFGSGSDSDTELNLILGGGYNFSETLGLEGRFCLISDSNSLSAQLNYYFR